ncbi:hypothetical protein Dimus_004337 [Dionaea muscipula]
MAPSKLDPQDYTPIPQSLPHQPPPQNYIILPFFYPTSTPRRHRRRYRGIIFAAISLILLSISVYILWPSDPELKISRLSLHRVSVQTHPRISIDVSLNATVRVRNRALYSMDYERLEVALGYRGEKLGHVTSTGGHVSSRGSSYVDAVVEFDGVEVLFDWIYLVEDLAKGMIPFDTVTQLTGRLGFFHFQLPIQGKISCEIDVNTRNQTIIHQNCYPESCSKEKEVCLGQAIIDAEHHKHHPKTKHMVEYQAMNQKLIT